MFHEALSQALVVGSMSPLYQYQWGGAAGLWASSSVGPALAALVAQSISVLGSAPGSRRKCKLMDKCLSRLHAVMDVHTRLPNTAAILVLYLHHLSLKLVTSPGNPGLAVEVHATSGYLVSLSKEQTSGECHGQILVDEASSVAGPVPSPVG